ncbi:hypothetical protein BHE74_00023258 [Ensete ventricosum]|nr:hypothetical protein GW17_00019899 [Ensete ventricosum]RWW69154.1 hypothetical protein BHE74_00023258 [Ensete ventricosum]
MEEVWKDITVTTLNRERPITPLQHHGYGRHHHHAHSSPSFRDMMLQDFLAGPLSRPLTISPPAVKELRLPPPPTPPPLPQTALSLNSGMELQYLGPDPKTHSDSTSSNHNASIISSAFSSVMAGPPSSTGLFSLCSKKQRLRENPTAYTNELELEVSRLKEENAKLKKQYEEKAQQAGAWTCVVVEWAAFHISGGGCLLWTKPPHPEDGRDVTARPFGQKRHGGHHQFMTER